MENIIKAYMYHMDRDSGNVSVYEGELLTNGRYADFTFIRPMPKGVVAKIIGGQEGEVFENSIWLREKDFPKAIDIFKKYYHQKAVKAEKEWLRYTSYEEKCDEILQSNEGFSLRMKAKKIAEEHFAKYPIETIHRTETEYGLGANFTPAGIIYVGGKFNDIKPICVYTDCKTVIFAFGSQNGQKKVIPLYNAKSTSELVGYLDKFDSNIRDLVDSAQVYCKKGEL